MQLSLRCPMLWPQAGELRRITGMKGLTGYERALLYRLGYATAAPFYPLPSGDLMHDDVSSALRLVTPAASQPVSLAVAKQFLRIEHSADDTAINNAIAAATQYAQNYLRVALLPQSWEYIIGAPPEACTKLPVGPATAITTVHLIDLAGAQTLLSNTAYRLSRDGRSIYWLSIPGAYATKIVFVAGSYADAASVPAPIVQGILHHAAAMLEHRDGVVGMPPQSINQYAAFRQVTL